MATIAIIEVKPMTPDRAAALEGLIIKGINDVERYLWEFIEGRGWEHRGYTSFFGWWDDKLVSIRLGQAIRAVAMTELGRPDPKTGRQLTPAEIGERVGVSDDTVRREIGARDSKIKKSANAEKSIKKKSPDPAEPQQEAIDGEVVCEQPVDDENLLIDGESEVEASIRLTKQITQAKKILLNALTDPRVTTDIIKLVIDDLIPQLEQEAMDAEKRMQW